MNNIKPVAYIHYWIGGYPPDGYIEESELLTPFQAEAYKDLESNEAHGISPLYAIPEGYHIVAIDHEQEMLDNIDRQDLKAAIFNLDRVAQSVSDRIKIES